MNLSTPFLALLQNRKASVRLCNCLGGYLDRRMESKCTLGQFIACHSVAMLKTDCFGFGKKARAELRTLLMDISDQIEITDGQYNKVCDYINTLGDTPASMTVAIRPIAPAGPSTIFIGDFALSSPGPSGKPGSLWLESASGEALETSQHKLEPVLRKFFNREF